MLIERRSRPEPSDELQAKPEVDSKIFGMESQSEVRQIDTQENSPPHKKQFKELMQKSLLQVKTNNHLYNHQLS